MVLKHLTMLLKHVPVLLNDIFDFQDLGIGVHASPLSTECIVSTVSPSVKNIVDLGINKTRQTGAASNRTYRSTVW